MECNFCKSVFSSKTNLNSHQTKAKYCLEIQGKTDSNLFKCEYCLKVLSSEKRLKSHYEICSYFAKVKVEDRYNERILELQEIIRNKDIQIQELQNKLENIAIKAISKPTSITTNNNNNSRVNQIINNLTPITSQHMADNAQFLTLDHIKDGASGYAKYALEYPLKDKILCVDYARRKIKYKDEEGNLVDDPEMTKLCKKFFIAIESHNNNLLNSYNTSILERMLDMNNDGNNEMTEEEGQKCMEIGNILLEEMMKVKNLKTDIEDIKKGNKPVMYHDFVKDVCSKTVC
jgi:hypothetical protein